MAVPFRKVSKTRKRMRRAHNALTVNTVVKCNVCGEMLKPHRVCPKCGSYKGKTVIDVKVAEAK
ncbi:MAG: 50S ribosomal protein L32 [Bacilli bacterium]